jgi:undecaprenyl-diphosphatase
MFEILILSFIQGMTEFLPISSSGHLILLPHILNWSDHNLEVDVALHAGTLLAVLCYFFKDFWAMFLAFFKTFGGFKKSENQQTCHFAHLAQTLIIATIPAIIGGYIIKKFIGVESLRSVTFIAINGIVWACIMCVADYFGKKTKTLEHLSIKHALIIGITQVFALLPGSSRSGTCMTAARFLGFNRVTATQYAFYVSVPPILGAIALVFGDAFYDGLQTPLYDIFYYVLLSFLFGISAIHFLLKYVRNHAFTVFIVYRLILGVAILF